MVSCIHNLSKPIVFCNVNANIHLLALEERFIFDMMNINVVLEQTTGDILELCQLLKIPEANFWRYVVFN